MLVPADMPWSRLLARWSLAQASLAVGLLIVFLVGVGFDPALPADRAELVGASRSLGSFRLAMVFDGLSWASVGGTLLIFAGLFAHSAPKRAVFAAACGAGMVSGILGSTLRLDATSDLAGRYAAASPEQQTAIVDSYLLLAQVITSHFAAGHLMQILGFGLAASMALGTVGFPRWIALSLALLATSATAFFALDIVDVFSFPLLIVHVLVFSIALNVAIALRLWNGLSASVPPLDVRTTAMGPG